MLVVLLTCARRCLAPGPSIFITGFVEAGLRVLGGHETILSDAWLAEYYWSDKHDPSASKSIAVELHGEDNYVSNVIVFDYAKVGVLVDGAATLLSGVHTWNGGGVGISINGTYNIQDRILGCYLDYNYLEIVQPFVENQENTSYRESARGYWWGGASSRLRRGGEPTYRRPLPLGCGSLLPSLLFFC